VILLIERSVRNAQAEARWQRCTIEKVTEDPCRGGKDEAGGGHSLSAAPGREYGARAVRPARWICWAPNDYATWYRLDVRVNGHALSPAQIEDRYQLPGEYVYQNPPQNIEDIIRQYEQTYGSKDQTQVNLLYREAGGPPQQWRWPPH
jgi:hypothetical protein